MEKLINKKSVLEVAKGFTFTDKAQEKQYMDFLKYCLDNANDNSKSLTNADRIRSMTDEQLADLITNIHTEWIDEYEYIYFIGRKQLEEYTDILEWLKSEVGCE